MFYIYFYYEPDCALPFYVGKGSRDRFRCHLEPNSLILKDRFHCKLRQMIQDGYKPEIELIHENISELQAFYLEKKYIKRFRTIDNGGTLYNLTDGGEGPSGCKRSSENRLQISISMKGKQNAKGAISTKRKRIACYFLGKKIKEYDFVNQVKLDGYHLSHIRNVLDGKYKEAYGYTWRYL